MAHVSLLALVAIAVPVYFILVSIYRLTLHPLAKYPGPLLWKISGWPDGFAARTGKRHRVHQQLHAQYGHIVRTGPNQLSFDTQQAVQDIYTDRNANVAKAGFVSLGMKITDNHHVQIMAGRKEHGQRRRLVAHAFSEAALKSAELFLLQRIRNWCDALLQGSTKATDAWSHTKDIGHWTNLLTLDILGELCFGSHFGATDAGDHEIIHFMLEGAKMSMGVAHLPIVDLFVPIFRSHKLLKLISPNTYARRWNFRLMVQDRVKSRRQVEEDAEKAGGEARKDFFHYLLKGRDPQTGATLSEGSYISEAALLVAAGTDTTSTAMSACLFYLNRDRSKLEKLRSEIGSAFNSVEDIRIGTQLSSMTYLRACIDEAMRMTPPVPGTLSRITLAGGATIDSQPLPANIGVDVAPFCIMHNPEYYPDPFSFTPERWILGSKMQQGLEVTEDLISRQRAAFVPFSSGVRNCLGRNLAYMEMTLVLARMVFLFDMRFEGDKIPGGVDFDTEDCFVSSKEGPFLQFKLRDESMREGMLKELENDKRLSKEQSHATPQVVLSGGKS